MEGYTSVIFSLFASIVLLLLALFEIKKGKAIGHSGISRFSDLKEYSKLQTPGKYWYFVLVKVVFALIGLFVAVPYFLGRV